MFPGSGCRQSAAECTKSSFWYNLPVHSFDLRVSVLVKRWQHCSVRWLLTLFLWVYLLLTRLLSTIDPGMLVLDWLCFCLSPRAALSRPQPARHGTQSRQFIKIWWWVTAWSDLLELETIHQHWPGLSLRAEVAATFVTMNQVLSHVPSSVSPDMRNYFRIYGRKIIWSLLNGHSVGRLQTGRYTLSMMQKESRALMEFIHRIPWNNLNFSPRACL